MRIPLLCNVMYCNVGICNSLFNDLSKCLSQHSIYEIILGHCETQQSFCSYVGTNYCINTEFCFISVFVNIALRFLRWMHGTCCLTPPDQGATTAPHRIPSISTIHSLELNGRRKCCMRLTENDLFICDL